MDQMNVTWLLQKDVFGQSDTKRLSAEVARQGIEFDLIENHPFAQYSSSTAELITKYNEENRCAIFHGSIDVARYFKTTLKSVPGVYYTFKNYDCSCYYNHFGKFLLNRDYIMLPFGDLNRCKNFLFSKLGQDDCIFIRPNRGNKLFTGKLFKKEIWDAEMDYFSFYKCDPTDILVVSSPKNILKEFRFIVVDNKIVTGSLYKENQTGCMMHYEEEVASNCLAAKYAQAILNTVEWSPDRAWSLDICSTKERMHVLEIGCFSCSGLYACNLEDTVREVSRIALEEWKQYWQEAGEK